MQTKFIYTCQQLACVCVCARIHIPVIRIYCWVGWLTGLLVDYARVCSCGFISIFIEFQMLTFFNTTDYTSTFLHTSSGGMCSSSTSSSPVPHPHFIFANTKCMKWIFEYLWLIKILTRSSIHSHSHIHIHIAMSSSSLAHQSQYEIPPTHTHTHTTFPE